MNSRHYKFTVMWSKEDGEFVGLCAEFPSLSWLDKDQAAAFLGIVSLVGQVVADMEANGEAVPEPCSLQKA